MNRFFSFLIGLISCFHSFSQFNVDSLKNVFIDKSYEDSCRLDAFKELTNLFLNSEEQFYLRFVKFFLLPLVLFFIFFFFLELTELVIEILSS